MERRSKLNRELKIKEIAFHRNGISGLPFQVAIVEEKEGAAERTMLIVRFTKEADNETGNVVCAAFDIDLLAKKEIRFGYNSWRGDHYSEVIDSWNLKQEQEIEKG